MKYRDLVFDLYGTLVDIHTEESADVWEKTALYAGFYGVGYTGRQLKKAFLEELSLRQAQAGQGDECFPEIPFEKVMAALLRGKGVREDADALAVNAAQLFRISSIEYIRLYPCVKSSLARLRRQGHRLWLLSNAQRVFTACELRLLGLDRCFDGIYLSSDYSCRKPDQRFYRALTGGQQLDPAACLMIGNDRETDIAGAKAAGMATLYMHTNLTPGDQAAADPALHPSAAGADCRHYEVEGSDWKAITQMILHL